MRILFVTNAGRYNLGEQLGMMYLSTILREAGHETRFAPDMLRKAQRVLTEWKPDVVGYTATTGEHRRLAEFNRRLKASGDFLSVFGGPHPTFFPEMISEDGIDAICRGEGEGAVSDLVESLAGGRPIENIPNLWVKAADGTIHKNAIRPFIEDLDALSFPDRQSFYRLYNRPRIHGLARFIASRGCPFNCTFCFNKPYNEIYAGKGKRIRRRSPENVVREVEQVARDYPFDVAIFTDDLFPTDKTWLEEFSKMYRTRVGLPFFCHRRAELVDRDGCRLLKEAGCHAVMLGIETGNEVLRREVLNRQMSDETIKKACNLLHEADIRINTTNIVGIPRETIETAMDTLRLNIACRSDHASAFFCQPYPGSELAAMARSMGMFDGKVDDCGTMDTSVDTWRIADKEKLLRLRALIGPVTGMPFLAPMVPFLIRLPLKSLYASVSKLWTGYCTTFRIYPIKLSLPNVVRVALTFFRGRMF
jgi:radical SAM superfamily enzyme YgiQ (UPF0313 family)